MRKQRQAETLIPLKSFPSKDKGLDKQFDTSRRTKNHSISEQSRIFPKRRKKVRENNPETREGRRKNHKKRKGSLNMEEKAVEGIRKMGAKGRACG